MLTHLIKYYSGDHIQKNEKGGACGTYGEGRGDLYTGSCWGNLRERDQLEDLGVDGRTTLKYVLREVVGKAWTVLVWLSISSVCECL